MNLAQKYRPKILDDIVGHEKIVKELKKRIEENNIPQTLMFNGLSGTGKTTIVRIVSKHILCKNNCCNECEICKAIDNEQSLLNYYEYNASNINIEEMRKIEEIAQKGDPFSKSIKKVFYIDEMQELSRNKAAMKNILKILEKPLPNVYFILGTMDISKIDTAIKRRSVKYNLKSLEVDSIANELARIASLEEYIVDSEEKAELISAIAESCNGSLGIAMPLLERLIYSDITTEKELIDELGIATDKTQIEMINKLLSGDGNFEIPNDIVDSILFKLQLFAYYRFGKELNAWEKSQIRGINSNIVLEDLVAIITNFASLYNYNYLNKTIIQSHLLESLIISKKVDMKKEVPKRKPRK